MDGRGRLGAGVPCYSGGMDREARAAEILGRARQARRPLPRGLWIASIAVAVLCAGALAIAWLEDRDAPATHLPRPPAAASGDGFVIGLIVGVVLGLAIGITLGLRRGDRQRRPEA